MHLLCINTSYILTNLRVSYVLPYVFLFISKYTVQNMNI